MAGDGSFSARKQRAIGSVPNPSFRAVTPSGNMNPCNCCLVVRFDFSQTEPRSARIPRPRFRPTPPAAEGGRADPRPYSSLFGIRLFPGWCSCQISSCRQFGEILSKRRATMIRNHCPTAATH